MQVMKFDLQLPEIKDMKEGFLSIGITLSDADLIRLFRCQDHMCKRLDWVETEKVKRMHDLIEPFLACGYLYEKNYMDTLRTAIEIYYLIRSRFTWSVSDMRILEVLYQQFIKTFGLDFYTLYHCIEDILKKEVELRYESAV